MSFWQALLLGIVQGLTEFLPVSSSGHLILTEHLLGFNDLSDYILFDLACHLGTLGAVFIFFWQEIKKRLFSIQVLLATLPLFPLVFVMKKITHFFDRPEYLGIFFLITSLILFLGDRVQLKKKIHPYVDALWIGISQATAIFPGVSRSGTTISVAKMLGWSPLDAVTFSFLLSIPTVLGGIALHLLKIFQGEHVTSLPLESYAVGVIAAFIMGLLSLKLLIHIVRSSKFQIFAWYTAILGILTLLYFNYA